MSCFVTSVAFINHNYHQYKKKLSVFCTEVCLWTKTQCDPRHTHTHAAMMVPLCQFSKFLCPCCLSLSFFISSETHRFSSQLSTRSLPASCCPNRCSCMKNDRFKGKKKVFNGLTLTQSKVKQKTTEGQTQIQPACQTPSLTQHFYLECVLLF